MLRNFIVRCSIHTKPYRIFLSQDESCFVAHHPAEEHPYEATKPLPQTRSTDESILKVNSRDMITKAPNLEQLQALTRTHRSYWRQTEGLNKRKKMIDYYNDTVDRPGLTS